MAKLTPMMQQYLKIHEQVPDALLFFRLGDFYEMFFDDAITASSALDLVLTGKDCGLSERAPMCGIPYHASDGYIAKLVEKGYRVAICEQVSDPKESKGLVEREIVRIISSGTIVDEKTGRNGENNFLMCVYYNRLRYGVSYCDVSTGETYATLLEGEDTDTRFLDLLSMVNPSEVLINTQLFRETRIRSAAEKIAGVQFTPFHAKYFNYENAVEEIKSQLGVFSLGAAGLMENELLIKSCGALFTYLKETQKTLLKHINKIILNREDEKMIIDYATKRNLEILSSLATGERKGSLLWVLDSTKSSVGARTLRQWISEPLLRIEDISARHEAISELCENTLLIGDIQSHLEKMADLQKLCTKISYRTVNGRDLLAIGDTLGYVPELKRLLKDAKGSFLKNLCGEMDSLDELKAFISECVNEQCSANIKDGNLIKAGYDEKIDEYRNLRQNAKKILSDLEMREKESTGIKNLKVRYNRVFGYFIEVSKSNIELVPDRYIRKQTLVNAERYFTEELKDIEIRILHANDALVEREGEIYERILSRISEDIIRIQKTSKYIGELDAITSLAYVSFKNGYVRPKLNTDGVIRLKNSRHPVVEMITGREEFIANDVFLDMRDNRMDIITGPNMAGKSTYIRQVAVISLLCQIGSFVPCDEADMAVVDRIFTRVGASDDLSGGQSTFMVEMSEVSNILKHATDQSLVILDEVGRGTSTFDGLSIAWAVAEYLLDSSTIGCKTLFATHYHELTRLEEKEGIRNYSIAVKQTDDRILFLHKIEPVPASKSYGIEVAKLAGLPKPVLKRAGEILHLLEVGEEETKNNSRIDLDFHYPEKEDTECSLSEGELDALMKIRNLPINSMTPIEALNFLSDIKSALKEGETD